MTQIRRGCGVMLVLASALALSIGDAWAQGAAALPLEKAVVSNDSAKRTLMKMQINATTARAIVDACVEFARTTNASYSVFVLAPTGDVVDAHVMDGQFPIAVEAAMLKAKTALYARSSSSAVAQRFSTSDGRMIRLRMGESSGRAYYFVAGGLPIVVEDQLIGAIGVGGGPQEEMCAHQALTKVLGPQPPLTPAPAAAGARVGGAAPLPSAAPGTARGQ
jgi:glc operon protein GlcG